MNRNANRRNDGTSSWEAPARPRPKRTTQQGRARSNQRPSQEAGRTTTGYTPLATAGTRTRTAAGKPPQAQPRRERHPHRRAIVALVAAVALLAVGLHLWTHRPVRVTVDGTACDEPRASSLEQVMEDRGIEVKAGNLVSINGNVITEGGGYALSATVNGGDLSGDDAEGYRIKEGDDITLSDGTDRQEDYTEDVEDALPYLKMDGNVGAINYVSQWGTTGRRKVRHGKVSGETADGDVVEAWQDCVISVRNVKPDNGQKIVALTFDDGPAETYTQDYLDILDRYQVHATFFNLGKNIEQYPDLAKKVLAQGSQIMSHTYSHQQLTKLDEPSLQDEVTKSFDAIRDSAGVDTTTIRPPYGAFRESTWLKTGGRVSLVVNWNRDSEDWAKPGVDKIVSNVCDGIQPGDIILMHDGGGNRDEDVEALPTIIETLQGQGYTITTVSDLLKSDSSIPSDVAEGDATMPDGRTWPSEISPDDLAAAGE